MNNALERFQHGFAQALRSSDAPPHGLVSQPAFAVYRNTVMKAWIDALQANYPSVARQVGEAWFRAAAAVYVQRHPACEPCLLRYAADFPEFLAAFEPAAELPYLPGIARLDRLRTECHVAPDAAPLLPAALAALAPEQLGACVLRPHPAARWAWFDGAPVFSIWRANNEDCEPGTALDGVGEGALLARPHDAVHWMRLDRAGVVLLEACHGGASLGEAAAAVLMRCPDADLSAALATLLQGGAFAAFDE